MRKSDKILFDFMKTFIRKNILETATMGQVERILAEFRAQSKREIRQNVASVYSFFKSKFLKEYYKFVKKDVEKKHGIKPYRLEMLKPKLRKQVEEQTKYSISLVKNQDEQFMKELEDRFINWALLPVPDMRGSNEEEVYDIFKEDILRLKPREEKYTKHQAFILRDQMNKLHANMDDIVAKSFDAIAFIWWNRGDKRVVGNPEGLYPVGSKIHEDHWDRQEKLYFIADSSAIKKGYLKPNKEHLDTSLADGRPGVPIGCRCWAEYIYYIDDLPEEYRYAVTEKGKKYLGLE